MLGEHHWRLQESPICSDPYVVHPPSMHIMYSSLSHSPVSTKSSFRIKLKVQDLMTDDSLSFSERGAVIRIGITAPLDLETSELETCVSPPHMWWLSKDGTYTLNTLSGMEKWGSHESHWSMAILKLTKGRQTFWEDSTPPPLRRGCISWTAPSPLPGGSSLVCVPLALLAFSSPSLIGSEQSTSKGPRGMNSFPACLLPKGGWEDWGSLNPTVTDTFRSGWWFF